MADRKLIEQLTAKANYRLMIVVVLLFLSGCASRVNELPEQAKVQVPKRWQTHEKAPAKDLANEAAKENTEKGHDASTDKRAEVKQDDIQNNGWLAEFNDTDLQKYIETALKNNPDLWNSAAELKNAIEQVTVIGSALWPSLRLNANASNSESSAASATGGATQGDDSMTTEIRSIGSTLDISWELDVWRKLSERKKAAAYDAQAQTELYKAAELSLVANVSRAWYDLATNKLQLDLAQQRLESFESTAALVEENYERGIRSALDVYLSRTDVQQQRSSLADSKFNYVQSLRSFKTLLGEYPDAALEFTAHLPTLEDSVPTGLPAELLTRRPDIKASRLRYQAQIANAKAAHRDRFPSLNFNGSIGESRDTFNDVFRSDNMIMRLLAQVTQPVFAAGALRSREAQANNDAESAYALLVKTILVAFEEVENTLSRESLLLEQHNAIKEAVKLAQGGLELALDRYQSGIENYTTVLQSQRSLFDSKRNELNLRNALLQNRISIHLALGGDFSSIENRNPIENLPTIHNDDNQQ